MKLIAHEQGEVQQGERVAPDPTAIRTRTGSQTEVFLTPETEFSVFVKSRNSSSHLFGQIRAIALRSQLCSNTISSCFEIVLTFEEKQLIFIITDIYLALSFPRPCSALVFTNSDIRATRQCVKKMILGLPASDLEFRSRVLA